jgi:hypothetical protein
MRMMRVCVSGSQKGVIAVSVVLGGADTTTTSGRDIQCKPTRLDSYKHHAR